MKNYITGIQPTGTLHLGNILGSILPSIKLIDENPDSQFFFFIADLHSVTTIKDKEQRHKNIEDLIRKWAVLLGDKFGVSCFFYKQSQIPQIPELAWYLSSVTPLNLLSNSHAFKDKSKDEGLHFINHSLFSYPVLMAADILIVDSSYVPVGRDQIQHIEITRNIANKFNNTYGECLTIPNAVYNENTQIVIGTDGRKMSKSYGNIIDVFADEKTLKSQIAKIVTDSKGIWEPKNPEDCNIFQIYKHLVDENQLNIIIEKYKTGIGYGEMKTNLYCAIVEKFKDARQRYNEYLVNGNPIYYKLEHDERCVSKMAKEKLDLIKNKMGFS